MKSPRGPIFLLLAAALIVTASVIGLRPRPIPVEVAGVHRGPLQVSVEDLGETRSHDRYVVAAPVAGRLLRVLLRDGDSVVAGQSVATLAPLPLSARERDEAISTVDSATATEHSAQAQLKRVQADLAQARRDLHRLQSLSDQKLVPIQALDHARTAVKSLQMQVTSARHRAAAAAAQRRGAQSALAAITGVRPGGSVTLTLRAPATGRVLRVLEPSERVISSGTPIMVIGDLTHLEVVVEMLSTQAVRVAPGMPAQLLDWGGTHPLRARVRRVEPYAFTKISALGVEEKRTNVILDFIDSPGSLGDGYRVLVRIIVWSAAHVLQAPLSAVFRCGTQWCTYIVSGARARLRHIRVGHHNEEAVQVLSGLESGERVIAHPPNNLAPGARVAVRP